MTPSEFTALMPLITITIGLVVLLLSLAFARSHAIAVIVATSVLLATLVASLGSVQREAVSVMTLLVVDGLATFFVLLFVIAGITTCLLAYRYLSARAGELEEFYVLVVIGVLGAMVMASAAHFASFVLGLEILSISLYALVAYPEEKHPPLEAAMKYLVLSAVASTIMLFGIALIYTATGSLDFVASAIPVDGRFALYQQIGQAMLIVGLSFKLSLMPFHMWTPDVYQGAPAPVTGFIATVSKIAVFAILLRLALVTDLLTNPVVATTLSAVALLSMIGGNVLALMQNNLKRLLAYSSIAHMGYLIVAVLAVAVLPDASFAAESVLVYVGGYMLMTLVAFGVVSVLSSAAVGDDAQTTEHYEGLFWHRPVLATCLAAAMLSLLGMPLTIGFVGKLYLLAAGIQGALWVLIWGLIVGSAISVFYYVKVIYAMTVKVQATRYPFPSSSNIDAPSVVVLAVAVVVTGVYPSPLIAAVRYLIGDMGQ